MYFLVIQKIAKCSELEFCGKKLGILAILNGASSKSRRDSSKLYLKQSESFMDKELKVFK